MATMFSMCLTSVKLLHADGGYQGPLFRRAVAKIMARVNVEMIKAFRSRKRICGRPKSSPVVEKRTLALVQGGAGVSPKIAKIK